MKAVEHLAATVLWDDLGITPGKSGHELNVAGVYQDALTQSWTAPMCRLVKQLAEQERVQNLWYDVKSLSDTGILLDAIRAALVADVIVVSLYAADELPLDFYVWVDAWLPRRPSRLGALTALIGVNEPLGSEAVRTNEYLQAVARKAQLDFIPHERRRTFATPVSSIRMMGDGAGLVAPTLDDPQARRCQSYYHGGLNV